MGGNGEVAAVDSARRVCVPESRQDYSRIPQVRGGFRRQIQASASTSETRPAASEPRRFPKRFKGTPSSQTCRKKSLLHLSLKF